jgi:putative membrane protein
MDAIAVVLVGVVALIHLYIVYLEMFGWQRSRVRAIFGTTSEFAAESKTLAANQGLYNGFLAAGLIWGLIDYTGGTGYAFLLFTLGCVIVAGLYGGATANRRILAVQALPGALALIAVIAAH